MEIGVRIRTLRKARGMKQEDSAEALGVSVQTVSRWENGTNAPDIAMLPLLCTCFHVTSAYLLGLERKDNTTLNLNLYNHAATFPPYRR